MSAPPERRLATGDRRHPARATRAEPAVEGQGSDGAASPAPPSDAVAQRAAVPPPSAAPPSGEWPLRSVLSVLTTLGPPLTIATALMFYFGWARSDVQARYMGLDVSLFGLSAHDYVLHSIEAPGVREEQLRVGPGAAKNALRYRTTGLRFLVRSAGRLFLVHDGWTPRRGTVIVLPDNDQVRWQFSR
jgi:hypothetical protein